MKIKQVILIGLLLPASLVFAYLNGRDGGSQPIAYNHNMHVQENDMECLDCHVYAEDGARASIPNVELCRDCHEEASTESEAEAALLSYVNDNRRIPWRQINVVPDYAYFSHRRHVKLGELDCVACHGEVGEMVKPVSEPFQEVTMDWCMDCHEARNVSNDCYACHR